MNIDITTTPFSRYGQFIGIVPGSDDEGPFLIIRNARAMKAEGRLIGVRFLKNGAPVPFTINAEPHVIGIASSEGKARVYIRPNDAVVVDSAGLDIELKALHGCLSVVEGKSNFKFVIAGVYVPIAVLVGTAAYRLDRHMHEDGIQRVTHTSVRATCVEGRARVHLAVQLQERPVLPVHDPDKDIAEVEAQWLGFRAKMMPVPQDRLHLAELAWYNLWSAFVRPEGFIKYDGCLMSKSTMTAIWSWDHCFNALAVAHADPMLGLQQWLLPFELQSETGQIPDRWSSLVSTWATVKPPVHGWALTKLLKHFPAAPHPQALPEAMLRKLYTHLEKWTDFWFTWRDTDADGIPDYTWGCDSGWDNSTLFDPAFCPEAPDLSAYLVLQMDALAELAARLGDAAAEKNWTARADALLEKLYEHSWKKDRFVAPISITHAFDPEPTSLLIMMPLVLGDRLDPAKCARLVEILKRDFLAPYGLATEALSSPLFINGDYTTNPNGVPGYWRGPIWAPSTYLAVDGLARAGHGELARDIARRFCNMVREAGGHYENHDPMTGKGLCDPGYTWTAAVHLLLLNEYLL